MSWPPKFRSYVHAHAVDDELLVLVSEWGIEPMESRLFPLLAALVNGEMTADEILAQSGKSLGFLDVNHGLGELRRIGAIADVDEPDPLADGAPLVWVEGRGACRTCMTARLREVRVAWGVPDSLPLPTPAIAPADADGRSRLLAFDRKARSWRAHAVLRRPDCPACGTPIVRRSYMPPVLRSRRKTFTADGGHRAATPEETWAKYEHLISPLTGIVHSVERADAGRAEVYMARHNFRFGIDGIARGRSYGKGITSVQARTGALCEALERYSGICRGDEPVVRATLAELGDAAIHPNACLRVSERQYERRNEWNARMPLSILRVPERFDEEEAIDWAPVWSMTRGETRYLPAAYCYYDHPIGENRFCDADSNGAAAGSSIEDATLQAVFELVERDAAAIWWYGRCVRPAAELQTDYGEAMRREYAADGRRFRLLDLTTDLAIPVFAAVSGSGDEDLLIGFGAHFDPVIAASRAISEMNQRLPYMRSQKRSGLFTGELTERAFLHPHPTMPVRTLVEGMAPVRDDLLDDVTACVDALRERGLEMLLLDQTREEIGLPVVRVIVPGLRHFWPRFAEGRLYDVPLRLGWTKAPLTEDDLNPALLML